MPSGKKFKKNTRTQQNNERDSVAIWLEQQLRDYKLRKNDLANPVLHQKFTEFLKEYADKLNDRYFELLGMSRSDVKKL